MMQTTNILKGFLVGFIILICQPFVFAGQNSELTNFWKQSSKLTLSSSSNYLANLKKLGVIDPNSLVDYLDSTEFQLQALYSMLLFENESNRLEPSTTQRVMDLALNSSTNSQVRITAFKLLLNHIQEQEVLNFMSLPIAEVLSIDESDQALATLGMLTVTNQERFKAVKKVALAIIGFRLIYATGGMACNGKDSAEDLISAVQWPLYGEPDIARSLALVFISRMNSQFHLLKSNEFEPAINFLILQSKADPIFLVKKLNSICSGDRNLASAVLWQLNKLKNSSYVAEQTLKSFLNGNSQNKDILMLIQEGKISREDAFNKAIQSYCLSKRLR
jgi:hypothetical protein